MSPPTSTTGVTIDHNSNRLTKTLGGVTSTYSYDHADKLTGITGGTTQSFGYDNNGNCTSIEVGTATTTLSYDYENRITGITYPSSATNSFSYNGNDLRIKKVDSGGTKNYITDGDTPASDVLSDGAATYTPGLSERRGSTSSFYHGDALGSNRAITSSSQAVTATTLFDGFGMTVSTTGSSATPFGYVGDGQYQQDSDSGLMLLGHRYYSASIGRFLSKDPIHDGNNWYAYCDNNPEDSVDPSGLFHVIIVIGSDGKGHGVVYADEGDTSIDRHNYTTTYKGGEQVGAVFPISNVTTNMDGDPMTPGSDGPFPVRPGTEETFPITGYHPEPGAHGGGEESDKYGVGSIIINGPGGPHGRPTWIHGASGKTSDGTPRTIDTPTHGCIHAPNHDVERIGDLVSKNPNPKNKKGNRVTVIRDPTP